MPIDKIIDPNIAASAYTNTAKVGNKAGVSGNDDVTFSDFLRAKTEESIDTLRAGEKMAAKAVTEEADLTDVVEAVTAAELTLQTVISVRDRLISSYQDIMRMPI